MMRKIDARLLLVIFVFALAGRAAASEVKMKNGDRISGIVVERSDAAIVVQTNYAGRITIDRSHIEAIIEPAAKDPDTAAPLAATPKQVMATPRPAPAKARLFGGGFSGLIDGWEGNANIGFSFTSGNSNNTTMTTGVRAVKHGTRDDLTVYARNLWNSTRGNGRIETTQNAFWGGARYDRNIGRKVFGFVSYDFESDRPKGLHFRSVVGTGLGHHTIKNEHTEIDLLAGGAWNRTWQRGPDTDTPEALAGVTLKHRFTERIRVQKAFTWFQNATDAAEYRYIFDATLSVDVTKRIGFYLSAGDRFNNDPVRNAKKNDFLFTTGMKWNFGKKK